MVPAPASQETEATTADVWSRISIVAMPGFAPAPVAAACTWKLTPGLLKDATVEVVEELGCTVAVKARTPPVIWVVVPVPVVAGVVQFGAGKVPLKVSVKSGA